METSVRREGLFWRAVVAFLVLPGTVGFLVPWLLVPAGASLHAAGIPVFAAGLVVLLWCVRDFYAAGCGTLAPWTPPRELVVVGLYRISRNPMYIGVLLIIAGWALTYASRAVWIYLLVIAVAFQLRIVFGEEPWLARQHGDAWTEYRNRVPRWLFRT